MSTLPDLAGALPWYACLLRAQYWSAARRAAYVERHLEATLAAANAIPFYAARFAGRPGPHDLAALPILARRDVPDLNAAVRALHPSARLLADRSSGSTGMPVEFLFGRAHQRSRFAARARYLRANGWSPLRRNAWIIYLPDGTPDGELVGSRAVGRTRFLSVFTPLERQLDWLRALDAAWLYTLPSNLDGLLDIMERRGDRLASLRRVCCGGEVLDEALRRRARRVLGVEIADNYGSTEACLAWQCPAGGYHVNAEHVLMEILAPDGRAAAPGEMGRVVVTTLHNRLMPLVRYQIGDYAVAAAGACRCGRTLPLIGSVVGRAINLFRLADGRLISPWAVVVRIKHRPELRQFQVVQKAGARFALRFVADRELTEDHRAALRQAFRDVVGADAAIDFERVDAIARTPAGKFMTAVSEAAVAG